MSLVDDAPLAGVDGWSERTCRAGGREQRWLERTIDVATGHVEQFHGHYGYASRSSDAPARVRTATPAARVVRPRPERTVRREVAPTVARRSRSSGLTVGAGALQTIHREISAFFGTRGETTRVHGSARRVCRTRRKSQVRALHRPSRFARFAFRSLEWEPASPAPVMGACGCGHARSCRAWRRDGQGTCPRV